MFEGAADAGRYVETFYVDSWMGHLREHERITHADRLAEEAVRRYQTEGLPRVSDLIAAKGRTGRQE